MNEFDTVAYIIGLSNGKGEVIIDDNATYTDPNNDGNIVITEG